MNLGTGKDQAIGGIGDDTFVFDDLNAGDVAKGGAGDDTLLVASGKIGADGFKDVSSIEHILIVAGLSGPVAASLTLNNDAFKGADLQADGTREVEFRFLDTADASLDASAVTNASYHVSASFEEEGNDTFIGGAGGDIVTFIVKTTGTQLSAEDHVDGGLGYDILKVDFGGAHSVTDADLAGVSGIEQLRLLELQPGRAPTWNSGSTQAAQELPWSMPRR